MQGEIKKLIRVEGVTVSPPTVVSTMLVFKYSATFNATTDWGSAAGGYYTITKAAATHGCGTLPNIQVLKLNGSNYEKTNADLEYHTAANGDVSIRTPETPDCRFAGKIIIF